MNPDGTGFTVVHNFNFTNGWLVQARLIEGSDNKLYGATNGGGTSSIGTVLSINLDGTGFTILKNIDGLVGNSILDELVEIPFINLPVTLNYFIAHEIDAKVKLSWATSEEENSDKFIVEKSVDGIRFNPMTAVHAAGNASSLTRYSIEDLHPINGKNYYRLQMIDKDGSFKYSPIRVIDLTKKNESLRFYPNPSHGELTIEAM